MSYDFKKEFKEIYQPKLTPSIVNIPAMNYVAMRGTGNPNEEGGNYQTALNILFGIAYTIKMSSRGEHKIKGFFEYTVPPLEGFWWQDNVDGVDYANKNKFNWISVIRLPDFVTKEEFEWAKETASKKKKIDCSAAEFLTVDEGLCVQILHLGSFDDEPASVEKMNNFIKEQGYVNDISDKRLHHEVYLLDAHKVEISKCKTIIRHPIRKV